MAIEKRMSECWDCIYRREVPGDAHIRCAKPDKNMTGNSYGIKNGWFFYPFCFDPVWKEKECSNYQTSETVSDTVSQEKSAKRPTN